jgi:tetratricopeptide (TPR) repeat protein
MRDKTFSKMTLEDAIKKAIEYSDKDLPFSELKYRKLIYQKTGKVSHQFWYADALRLCGYTKTAGELFLAIPTLRIPKEYRHSFYLRFGHLYKETGHFEKALHCYLKSLKLNGQYTFTYIFIADILKSQEKDKLAIKYLIRALKTQGDIDEVNYNLATSYVRVGQLENALKAIDDCLKIDPKFPNAKNIKKDIELLLKDSEKLRIDG